MLVAKRCNLCGGIVNADEEVYSVTLKQISGSKCTQLDSVLICRHCHHDIVTTMCRLGCLSTTEGVTVLPGIPER